ncbi:MAG: N-acetyltransferase [Caulobacteraceae bacterium]|nr:N-acetyltransferase [Caulobacter sp.]
MTDVLDPATAQAAAPPRFRLQFERREDRAAVDALIGRAFGPGRFAKTAERLREGARVRTDLSWCVWDGPRLLGAVRVWPLALGGAQGVFLGPIAVEADERRRGLGALLVERTCEAAADAGDPWVLLVGDAGFFEPLGFRRAPPGVRLPGPVDASRVFVREIAPGAAGGLDGLAEIPRLPRGARRASP